MDNPSWQHRVVDVEDGVRIAYIDCPPGSSDGPEKGTILLIHGFPQTSYQFRHVINPLAQAGYRVLAPDYRGAGASSKPLAGFTKSIMARDLVLLLDVLAVKSPIHVVGHDIGGMIAFNLVARHASRFATLTWGECPLPGTSVYDQDRTEHAVQQFHFIFHSVPDLPLALITGRERIYLSHFFRKIAYNYAAIQDHDLDQYVRDYEQPGAMRCALEVYRAFEQDAAECRDWIKTHGKVRVPVLCLNGELSRHQAQAEAMCAEVHEQGTYTISQVPETAHYIAEENPGGFVTEVLQFIQSHAS